MRTLEENLDKFTSDRVPEYGDGELTEMDPPFWKVSDQATDPSYPGDGLARYPMVYIGEGCNRIFLIQNGKIIWSYATGKGWELDDIWMLMDGGLLFSHMYWVGLVSPDKKLLWRYDCDPGTEIHSVQPAGNGRIYMMQNGDPPRLILYDMKSDQMIWNRKVPCDPAVGVHGQFRRVRITHEQTVLLPHLSEGKVVEYDMAMKPVWQYQVKGPWAAIGLHSGNTLITAEGEDRTIEGDNGGNVVWEIRLDEIPEPYHLTGHQSAVRLNNGNTILCSRGNDGAAPQLVEITPDKQVVWCIHDFKNLGPCTSVQILSEAGFSENPGELQR